MFTFGTAPRIAGKFDKLREPLIAAVLYFVLAASTIALTEAQESIAAVWPANAVLLALILRREPAAWWPILLAGCLGNAAAGFVTRGGLGMPILFSLINLIEVCVAAWGFGLGNVVKDRRLSAAKVWGFLLWGGLIAPMIAGLAGAATAVVAFGQPFVQAYVTWVVADGLGLIVMTPFLITLFDGTYAARFRESSARARLEAAGLYLLTAIVAMLVVRTNELPVLFLVTIPLMLVTYRMGWPGTNLAVMIVAATGAVGTAHLAGPVSLAGENFALHASLFQLFLASLLVTCMPLAAMVAASHDLMRELQERERSLRLVVSQSPCLLVAFDRQGICRKVFGARDLFSGVASGELVGSGFDSLAPLNHADLRAAHELALSAQDELFSLEFQPAVGSEAWHEATFCSLTDEQGRCVGTIVSIHDVTERKLQARALARSAMMDSLTGLMNRAGFMHRLDRALAGKRDAPLALAMIDVDRFKLINDNFGHPAGDLVLAEIGRRIAGEVRASDAVARLGGDEFVVLIDAKDGIDAQEICARIVAAVGRAPVVLPSGTSIDAAISCGLAWQRPGIEAEEFMRAADSALYEAKRGGRNRLVAA